MLARPAPSRCRNTKLAVCAWRCTHSILRVRWNPVGASSASNAACMLANDAVGVMEACSGTGASLRWPALRLAAGNGR